MQAKKNDFFGRLDKRKESFHKEMIKVTVMTTIATWILSCRVH